MLKHIHLFLFILLNSLSSINAFENIEIHTLFEPQEISLGQTAIFKITISGAQGGISPTIPKIDGLTLSYQSTAQNIQIIQGKTQMQMIYTYIAKPNKIGTLTVKPFDLKIDEKTYTTQAATLNVLEAGQATPHDPNAQLDIVLQRSHLYVGEMVPIKILLSAPIGQGGQFIYYPRNTNTDFLNYGLKEKPEATSDKKQIITWNTYFIPLKAGKLNLEYQAGLALQKKASVTRPSSRNFFNGNLNSFVDDLLNNYEEIDLTSKPLPIEVSILPSNGKPNHFTGAIGHFSQPTLHANPTETQVGEPIVLQLEVSGIGNLEQISPPIFENIDDWKTYPPKSSFSPKDPFGYTGTKTFEYVLIPLSEKLTHTPKLTFTSFDPEQGVYNKVDAIPIPLKITPAPENWIPPTISTFNKSSLTTKPELRPIKLKMTATKSSLKPILTQKWFLGLQAPPLLAIIGLFFYKKRRNFQNSNIEFKRSQEINKNLKDNLHLLKKAYSKNNNLSFYHAAQNIIKNIVAEKEKISPYNLGFNEITDFLEKQQCSNELAEKVKNIFQTADIVKFSGRSDNEQLSSKTLQEIEHLIHLFKTCEK